MALVFDGGIENGDSNDIAQKNLTGDNSIADLKKSCVRIDAEINDVDRIRAKFLSKYFTLNDLYRLSVRFYREKENKAFHVSYNDRTKLFAYTKVVKYGNFKELENSTKENNNNNNNDVGFFNFIGSDLKDCWEDLGAISREEAMAGFVALLDKICPQFAAFIEAQKQKIEDQAKIERAEKDYKLRAEMQRIQIQEALNKQTLDQFTNYARQLHPDSPEEQLKLIKHLQEQHYVQYMQQIYEQQEQSPNHISQKGSLGDVPTLNNSASEEETGESSDTEGAAETPSNSQVVPASIWTRKDIKEFKETIRKESPESVIKVGHGETVTVRVPTHEEGTCLFWEFATDDYDLGFGLYFEWTLAESNTVTVHVTESDEEDFEENANEEKKGDVEVGKSAQEAQSCKPQTDEILPVYRRDCHEEVHAGSHVYPGRGVYLLKFDNTYSLWRSKCLYYRIYYSK